MGETMRASSYWAYQAETAADSMYVLQTPSRVVPGLVYWRGSYVPPGTSHVGPFTAVVVSRLGAARILATTADWDSIARWTPRNSAGAAAACTELVATLPAPRNWGRVYEDSVAAALHLPYATLPSGSPRPTALKATRGPGQSWSVTLWWITGGRTIQQQCVFRVPGDPRSRTRLLRVDSIPVGFLDL